MANKSEVERTYSPLDVIFRRSLGKTGDYSGALFDGDFSLTLEEAQRQKHQYVLESLALSAGDRLIDLGCGWGGLLAYAQAKGIAGIGVSLSSRQVASCLSHGLEAYERDCRTVSPNEFGQFDGDAIRIEHDHLAERARVDEPCLVAVVEMEHDMGVGRTFGPRRREEHLSAHPQVDHRGVTRVERQQQILAASVGGDDHGVGQPVDERLPRRSPNGPLTPDVDTFDASTDEMALQTTANGLDLRQLGHRPIRRQPSERQASVAANCSAAFFDRPVPTPCTSPSTSTLA